jgi:S-methylmethionine-dependent homocysteine/selenocysteine methylase
MKIDNNTKFNSTILTDGGLETELIFKHDIDLPHFASFPMFDKPKYQNIFRNYFREYLEVAKKNKTGFILESPTWRASPDWGFKLGYSAQEIAKVNERAVKLVQELKAEYEDDIDLVIISGCIGPRSDGYLVGELMEPNEAKKFHLLQLKALKNAGAQIITAQTMTNSNEGLGIVLAAKENEIPVVISFTVELDGNLPTGESLESVINKIDEITDKYPAYYMINCAHPSHFIGQFENNGDWKLRIKGVRSNASCKSHAELNECTELDAGNAQDLANWHQKLKAHLPNLIVYGGCCGTDVSHIRSICEKVIHLAFKGKS